MSALIVNHPVPMDRVRVITLKDYSEVVLKTLQKIGVLHIEEAKELKPVDKDVLDAAHKEVAELLSFVTSVLSYIPAEKKTVSGGDFDITYTRPFREISGEVRLLYSKANTLRERIVAVDADAQKLRDNKKYLGVLPGTDTLKMSDLAYAGDFLMSRVFILPSEAYKSAEERLKRYLYENIAVEIDGEIVLHAVAETRHQKTLENMINDAGGRILGITADKQSAADFLKANDARLTECDAKMAELKKDLEEKVGQDVERLILLREALSAENDRLTALSMAAEAKYVTLIEGWVPRDEIEQMVTGVRESVDFAFIDTRQPENTEQPPSKLNNTKGVEPFQLIVELFGTPKYREWDPTPIVAYSFALFFGLMSQDVIYAFGIVAFAKFVLPKFVDDPNSEGVKLFKRVLYIGAGVSGVMGLITGSWLADFFPSMFGITMPSFRPIADVVNSPVSFIILAIAIGFVHVNIAHLFALLVGIKQKNKGVIVTKVGFFAFQLFLIGWIVAAAGVLPAIAGLADVFQYGAYGGIGILVIGIIMQNSYFGVLLWVFELTGLLGDVLSYSRLAGVGMAGFYLGSAINLLANIFRSMLPGPVGYVIGIFVALGVLTAGHLINTVLSIQGGFVHSMRLCLVEFMFKFYEGGGNKYSPFKFKTIRSLIVKEKTYAP